jgi:hypothetical protein
LKLILLVVHWHEWPVHVLQLRAGLALAFDLCACVDDALDEAVANAVLVHLKREILSVLHERLN